MNETVDTQIREYVTQLSTVEEALKNATGDQLGELLDLKSKLLEVVSLLQGSQEDEIESNGCITKTEDDMESELARFQMEISDMDELAGNVAPQETSDDSSEDDSAPQANQELIQVLESLEGSKCRAPFRQEWGEWGHYNAMIISADCNINPSQEMSGVMVKVMFCNPICERMKPCSFFLNGHCKFSDDRCRFSHGHEVNFSELQDFVLPDFKNLSVDVPCLAKGSDDIWHRAKVEKCLDKQKYIVKFERSGKSFTLDAQDILPFDDDTQNTKDSENESLSSPEHEEPHSFEFDNSCTADAALSRPASIVLWEQYTKGIGSKLMEKMGHVWGQGLGKNSDGRLDPIEAVILPSGKSLDKCMEMRENCNPKGPVALESRLALDQDKEEQKAKRIRNNPTERKTESVFDFLNSRISTVSRDGRTLDIGKAKRLPEEEPTSSKSLNVQIFTVGEDIKKAKKELMRLRQSLVRNSERNEVVRLQVEKKIEAQNQLIQSLQAKEKQIGENITSQTNHKKLTIF